MSGFLGTFTVNLDEKGRLNVPSKFKNTLENRYGAQLVTVAMEGYLIVFPHKEWEKNENRMDEMSPLNPMERDEVRPYLSSASDCEVKSGKILVPAFQREAVGLTKELVLVGMSRTFEIWPADKWKPAGRR